MRYCLFLFLINFCFNQGWYNHPELDWETIETDHFLIHFHKETSRSAREAAAVAEKIYDPVTSFYNFEPDSKTHIIIQDTDDISNGAAYYYDNKIIIWALPLDFDLRGSHRWLNNVITHEFVHIVQIGASMKYSRRFPASFLQFMNYEIEKREDVLYGYPNILISYPIPGVSVPPWLAEGTAQFMYPDANFDFWDSHRDMIVRDRILNNNLLSFNAMNSFGKRGIGNESIYNQGFLFSIWLAENYGNDILYKISKSLSKPFNYSINQSIKDITGKTGQSLYNEWEEYLKFYYKGLVKNINKYEKKGKILLSDGTSNIHPVWAPNEKKFVYLSNKENDGFGQTDLFSYSFIDSTSKKIMAGVKTAPTWINDSTLVYTKRSMPNKWGSKYFDLYKYSINEDKEKRITYNARLISPVYNDKTNNIAAISSYDGTSNILISEDFNNGDDTLNFNQITNYNNGIQLLSLSWHESKLLVDGVDHQGRKIFYVNQDKGTLEPIKNDYEKFENRDQHTAYLSGLVYTTDQSGINNLILTNGTTSNYITNVYGGAFMPCVSKGGKILYSLYENGKYNIAILDNLDKVNISNVGYSQNYFLNHNTDIEIHLLKKH